MLLTKLTKFLEDEQFSPKAATAISPIFLLLSLSTLPSSVSINSLTLLSNSSPLTNPFSSSFCSTAIAISMSVTRTFLFICCSAYSGQAIIGTPATTASSTEFHPQCVTNPPTDSFFNTATCGAHDFTTIPLSLILSKNPSGNTPSKSKSSTPRTCFIFSSTGGFFTTHRNLCPLASNPFAISFT
ncbi:hypothetical protein C1H46_022469 [Malus baccata]|uniref:Uncharacterized protein n=1 Tax=Malus baccata TaxID=106549 RepID=A0A540LZP8_MALBA|nr:hypothetical protein C1H46_022469 [Malus baccata]